MLDERFYKSQSLKWWRQWKNVGDLDLAYYLQNSIEMNKAKGWKWFAVCTIPEKEGLKDGFGWRYEEETELVYGILWIGQNIKGKLVGWGLMFLINISWLLVDLGTFEGGCLTHGLRNRIGTYEYRGDVRFNSLPVSGIMKWENGYQYLGQWKDGQPLDGIQAVHPDIRACLEEGICTLTFTKGKPPFGQYMGYSGTYCPSCVRYCQKIRLNFRFNAFCHCQCNQNTCQAQGTKLAKKARIGK